LQGTNRRFKEGVADPLIEELLKVRVETAQGEAVEVVGEYVEPVQLQVVCRNLWMSLPRDVHEISLEHLEAYGDVDQALRDFYESCLAEAKAGLRANERSLRQWFEHQLITPAGTRGIVFRDAKRTADLPNPVVDFLENRHLIRGEWRAGSRWYELTHDRFIEPIQRANERWRARRQANRNRWIMAGVGLVLLVVASIPIIFNTGQNYSQSPGDVSTIVAATVSVQATARATEQAQAQEEVAVSKSQRLSAEALLASDPDLALLLAVEANQASDTQEARKSLHRLLSNQAVSDGEFLSELDPAIISPTLVQRLGNHKNPVLSVAFSPNGRRFVSASSADFEAATLILWDIDVGGVEPVFPPMTGHRSNILSVAFSPDGNQIASGGLDQQILFWNASTGEREGNPLVSQDGIITSVAFSLDGKRLASGGVNGTVRIWDLTTGESLAEMHHTDSVWSVAWSPDGNLLASAGADSTVRLWETKTFGEVHRMEEHSGLVRTVAWSPDGRSLASGSAIEDDDQTDGEVMLWDAESGRMIERPLQDTLRPVRTVAFHPDGRILAIGQDDGNIILWDTRAKQILGERLIAHEGRVMSIAFSRDGRYMISGSIDGTVALWDLFTPTRSIAISPKGDMMATSQGAAISLWDLSTGATTPVIVLSGHTEDVLALAFSPDGNTLVSSGKDDTVRLWDVQRGQQLGAPFRTRSDVPTLQFSRDGSTLALAGESGRVQLLDPATRELRTFTEHDGPVIKLQFGEGGQTLQVVGKDGSSTTREVSTGDLLESVDPLPAARGGLTSIGLSQDGQKAAYFREGGTGETAILSEDERAHGIDISSWGQTFDPSVNPDDIDFIVIRATDGNQYVDPKFEEYLNLIQRVPIRGTYHVFRDNQPWKEQADLFLSTVKDKGFHFYVLDLEVNPGDESTQFLADAEQWLKYVDGQVEGRVLLEIRSSYPADFGHAGDWMKNWPLLIMHYPPGPDPDASPLLPEGFQEWRIWNYSATGSGADYGVGAKEIFLEVYNGTPQEMGEWLGMNAFTIYDQLSGEAIHPKQAIQVTSPNGIAFSPDGTYLATTGDGVVSLLDSASGEEITTLSVGRGALISLSFTPDGKKLAIGTQDGAVLLWDLSLLDKDTKAEQTLELACSLAQRNLTRSEWGQYFGTEPYRRTCPNLPLGRD
jgi:WD40 repeat protein